MVLCSLLEKWAYSVGIGTIALGFHSVGDRLGSTNTARKSGDFGAKEQRGRGSLDEKLLSSHQGSGRILAKST